MSHHVIDVLMALAIFLLTIVSGIIPFKIKLKAPKQYDFPIGEALANGVFLGAGLIHMLSRSASEFSTLGFSFPWAFFICGVTFLFFLLSEHIGFFIRDEGENQTLLVAIVSTVMLSAHSFFTGAALGITSTTSLSFLLFIAILAHKWAASFSLSVYINKTSLKFSRRLALFIIFSTMLPLGIYVGNLLHSQYVHNELIQPILTAIASGTFIYLGTLHGFKKILTQKGCCNLEQYFYVIFGFSLMALVAIWL